MAWDQDGMGRDRLGMGPGWDEILVEWELPSGSAASLLTNLISVITFVSVDELHLPGLQRMTLTDFIIIQTQIRIHMAE